MVKIVNIRGGMILVKNCGVYTEHHLNNLAKKQLHVLQKYEKRADHKAMKKCRCWHTEGRFVDRDISPANLLIALI